MSGKSVSIVRASAFVAVSCGAELHPLERAGPQDRGYRDAARALPFNVVDATLLGRFASRHCNEGGAVSAGGVRLPMRVPGTPNRWFQPEPWLPGQGQTAGSARVKRGAGRIPSYRRGNGSPNTPNRPRSGLASPVWSSERTRSSLASRSITINLDWHAIRAAGTRRRRFGAFQGAVYG